MCLCVYMGVHLWMPMYVSPVARPVLSSPFPSFACKLSISTRQDRPQ